MSTFSVRSRVFPTIHGDITRIFVYWPIGNIQNNLFPGRAIASPVFEIEGVRWRLVFSHNYVNFLVRLVKMPSPFSVRISLKMKFQNAVGRWLTSNERIAGFESRETGAVDKVIVNFRPEDLFSFIRNGTLTIKLFFHILSIEEAAGIDVVEWPFSGRSY